MTCSAQAAAEVELEATGLEIEDGTEETGLEIEDGTEETGLEIEDGTEETASAISQGETSLSRGSISGSRFRFLLSLALCNCCFLKDRAV